MRQSASECGVCERRAYLRRSRAYGSFTSNPAATSRTAAASSVHSAKIDTQSSDWHAGTTPCALTRPCVGFKPTILLKAAGTRPEPAVSVPREKLTRPATTAMAEPELEPPEMWRGSNALGHAP